MAICEDSTLKKKMILITVFLVVLFVVSLPIFIITKNDTIETITITIGIALYHIAMRLVVGMVVNVIMKNKANHNNIWFREKRFESKLYKVLGVRKWKKRLPTYSPETFDFKQKKFEQIVGATCQAEIVHEIIMVFSLLPIIMIPFLGGAVAIIITSVLATLFDFLFVILQRYNRPKLIRVMERFNKTLNKG